MSGKWSKDFIISSMQEFYEKHGESPKSNGIDMPFSKSYVQYKLGGWTNALIAAGIPVRKHQAKRIACHTCNVSFIKNVCQIKKAINNFCSSRCAAIHRNTGRHHSEETKIKISEALRAPFKYNNPCEICGNIHKFRKRKTCSKECMLLLRVITRCKNRCEICGTKTKRKNTCSDECKEMLISINK
jgi:hypothetical protein